MSGPTYALTAVVETREDLNQRGLAEVGRLGRVAGGTSRQPFSHRVDHWLTHPVLGPVIALGVMAVVFQLVFWAAEPASAAIDWLTVLASKQVANLFVWLTGTADGALYSLIVDGLIAGVGSVLKTRDPKTRIVLGL